LAAPAGSDGHARADGKAVAALRSKIYGEPSVLVALLVEEEKGRAFEVHNQHVQVAVVVQVAGAEAAADDRAAPGIGRPRGGGLEPAAPRVAEEAGGLWVVVS